MGLFDDIGSSIQKVRQWASSSNEDVPFEQMHKALAESGMAEPTEETPRALFHDPYSILDWGGWRQRPSAMTYETLRAMSVQNVVIGAIIQTRTNQVAQFCRPQQGAYDKGYRVILRDRRDNKKQMTKAEQKMASDLEAMIETTGLLQDNERSSDRDSFRHFMKKGVRDILTYDQFCVELIRDKKKRVSRFICLPSETIRPAVTDIEHLTPEQARERVAYVQVFDSTIIAEFGVDDLIWGVMNPRSDLRTNGFGFAPAEMMIQCVTAWLYGFSHNSNFFVNGAAIKGILNIKGTVPDRQLRAFRRMWYTMVSGNSNAWKTPIINSEDINWVSMHSNNVDMEFAGWMDWLTKLTCSIYGIDPIELNFIFNSGGGNKGSMFAGSRPNKDEVTESKDRGLVPLMDFITDKLNGHIIWELAPELEFSFTGLDAKSEQKERERRAAEVEKWRTVNEVRQEQDEPPLPDGDIILNPVYLQYLQGKQQQPGELGPGQEGEGADAEEQDPEGEGDFGEPDDELPEGEGDEKSFGESQQEALAAAYRVTGEAERLEKAYRREAK